MKTHNFVADDVWESGEGAADGAGYCTLHYSGDLGGGTLSVFTKMSDDVGAVPVADAKLDATTVDGNGDVVKQLVFQSAGTDLNRRYIKSLYEVLA